MRQSSTSTPTGSRRQHGEQRASRAAGLLALPAAGPGSALASLWLWAALGATVAVLGVVVVLLLVLQRRQRRQLRALLERLERIETRWAGGSPPDDASFAAVAASPASGEGDDSITPSGDVLAGRTTHVRRLVESSGSTARGLADQAIFCVHKHLEENVSPAGIADELFVSRRTLERGLAVSLDCTPGQLILAMKMREARRMLQVDHLRVAEVAERLGFANPFHFSRRFKAFYRVSPSELRREAAAGE